MLKLIFVNDNWCKLSQLFWKLTNHIKFMCQDDLLSVSLPSDVLVIFDSFQFPCNCIPLTFRHLTRSIIPVGAPFNFDLCSEMGNITAKQ